MSAARISGGVMTVRGSNRCSASDLPPRASLVREISLKVCPARLCGKDGEF